MKNLLVYYIDVGQLSPDNATNLINTIKSHNADLLERLDHQGVEALWLPIRPGSATRVESVPLRRAGIIYRLFRRLFGF